uniref:Uncharacterized protein n=1 Tax=Opuntia streptacantha TaxID=393608 RepID=A0A7C8YEA4_OPUST
MASSSVKCSLCSCWMLAIKLHLSSLSHSFEKYRFNIRFPPLPSRPWFLVCLSPIPPEFFTCKRFIYRLLCFRVKKRMWPSKFLVQLIVTQLLFLRSFLIDYIF